MRRGVVIVVTPQIRDIQITITVIYRVLVLYLFLFIFTSCLIVVMFVKTPLLLTSEYIGFDSGPNLAAESNNTVATFRRGIIWYFLVQSKERAVMLCSWEGNRVYYSVALAVRHSL